MRRISLLALPALLAVLAAAPAGAVVGGEQVTSESMPWFASLPGCGGTLVAPDRVLTAGHCVTHRNLVDLGYVEVGGALRRPTRFAMHPAWRHTNGANVLDDVAIVQLDQPVTGVLPVVVGGPPAAEAQIVGRGRPTVPGSGAGEAETFDNALRAAVLRPISDAACARAFRGRRGNGGERFDAPRMLCAIDVDGLAPLSSGCNGDSGGPLFSGSRAAPRLLGVVSWGGSRCGADRLPSVVADARRYRGFITDPSPAWAPATASPARITGRPRVGGRLTCTASGFTARPKRLSVSWQRQGGRRARAVGRATTYVVKRTDRGHPLVCVVEASNDAGISVVPFARESQVRVPR